MITMHQIMAYFGMSAEEMKREWLKLTPGDKKEIRDGIENGSYTY